MNRRTWLEGVLHRKGSRRRGRPTRAAVSSPDPREWRGARRSSAFSATATPQPPSKVSSTLTARSAAMEGTIPDRFFAGDDLRLGGPSHHRVGGPFLGGLGQHPLLAVVEGERKGGRRGARSACATPGSGVLPTNREICRPVLFSFKQAAPQPASRSLSGRLANEISGVVRSARTGPCGNQRVRAKGAGPNGAPIS